MLWVSKLRSPPERAKPSLKRVRIETLEAAGRIEEAAQARSEGEHYAEELPEKVQEVMLKTSE